MLEGTFFMSSSKEYACLKLDCRNIPSNQRWKSITWYEQIEKVDNQEKKGRQIMEVKCVIHSELSDIFRSCLYLHALSEAARPIKI